MTPRWSNQRLAYATSALLALVTGMVITEVGGERAGTVWATLCLIGMASLVMLFGTVGP